MQRVPIVRITSLVIVLAAVSGIDSRAQTSAITYAQGLTAPIGIEVDDQGRLWVSEQGTGADDSQISVITTDGQVHDFLVGLPSDDFGMGEISGVTHLYFDGDGNLAIISGRGTDTLSSSIHLVDTTGFVPGDPPLGIESIHTSHDIGTFVLDQGYVESNPYTFATGANGDLFIADAGANAIIRRENATGDLSVFATFPDVPNSTGIGPPMVNAVPTAIVLAGDRFYVGSLTGFPFANEAASVYDVDLEGNAAVFADSLTTVVDVAIDPRDGELVVLQHAAFTPPPPFLPNTGSVLKLRLDGTVDTLATGLNRPVGMRFSASGDLFISTLVDGEILKLEATATGIGSDPELPAALLHSHSYPNPFSTETRISYTLAAPTQITISVANLLGQEIRVLLTAAQPVGTHEVVWDGHDSAGHRVASGVYLYRIRSEHGTATRSMILLR